MERSVEKMLNGGKRKRRKGTEEGKNIKLFKSAKIIIEKIKNSTPKWANVEFSGLKKCGMTVIM